jgi:predicted RNase H-like nuclease (RuvC/YqgF family)
MQHIPSNFTLDEVLGIVNIPDALLVLIRELQKENEELIAENRDLTEAINAADCEIETLSEELESIRDSYAEYVENHPEAAT